MHAPALLQILAIGLTAALILGYLTQRLRLSPIVGYLLAGYLVGPHSPGFVADVRIASELAEVGVILLMFGVGLHFNMRDLLAVKGVAIPGALGQSLAATLLAGVVAHAFGMGLTAGFVLGMGVAVASTVVLIRVLMDNELLESVQGHVAVGWLIVEDILTVLALVLLPPLASALGSGGGGAGGWGGMATALGVATLKLAALWALVLIAGGALMPRVMALVARSRSRELFSLAVLAVAFAISVGSAVFFGASMALGAFLAGIVVGKTQVSHQAAADVLPMRDTFAVIFFLSVGMLFDPKFIVANPGLVASFLGIILIVKPLSAFLIVVALGRSPRMALTVALALAQIGEFSFILAQQAQALKMIPAEGYSMLVACALISITLNPLLFKGLGPVERWLARRGPGWRYLDKRAAKKGRGLNEETRAMLARDGAGVSAIVVGYGPVGRRVAGMLREAGRPTVVVDLNVDTINQLVDEGQPAIFGDASHPEILAAAGIKEAQHLLITLPELNAAVGVITSARALNPGIKILVRARHLGAAAELEGLGVMAVSFEEEEVARAMAGELLRRVI